MNLFSLSFKKVLLVFLLALVPMMFYGQDKKNTFAPYWYLKASIGPGMQYADITADQSLGFGADVSFGRQLSPIFGISGKIFMGSFNGQNALWDKTVDINALDFGFKLDVSLLNLIKGYAERPWNVRAFIGYGQTRTKVLAETLGGATIRSIGYTTKRNVAFSIPFGLGFDYNIDDTWSLTADFQMTYLDTDLFDTHTPAIPANGHNDYYSYLGLGVKYKLQGSGFGKMVNNFDQVSMTATPEVLEEKGNMVKVKIAGTIPPKYFVKNAGMILQPKLVYAGGETLLKPILLKGENAMGEGKPISYDNGGSFEFAEVFAYNPDMNKSKLVVTPLIYSAKNGSAGSIEEATARKHQYVDKQKVADGVIYTSERIANAMAYAGAKHGYEKETVVTKKATLYFAKNKYNYNTEQKLNKTEHAIKHSKAVHELLARGWKLKSIDIHGYASPEGEESLNDGLSEKRAQTMHKAAVKKMKKMIKNAGHDPAYVDMIKFNIVSYGADWKGLVKLVDKSDLADKKSIISKIKRPLTERQKEEEIRKLMKVYPEMENNMLPYLRRANVAVNAYQPKKTDEDISKLAISDPEKLDIYELLYAASMAKCDQALDIYKTIMKKYPKCWKSKNNAAVILMKHGKVDKAMKLLADAHKMYPKVAIVASNMGIAYAYKGDFMKAEKYFLHAQKLGHECTYNLGVIAIHKGDYAKAAKLFKDAKCNYNAGLAYLLNGNHSKAKAALMCVKANKAEAAYLLAVLGARTGDNALMYKYLIEAIKVNKDYKGQAKDDREFIKFENDTQFQAVVN
jgi:Flp pilus assembly protein TadD/outer membrane protein OmpA-like peptidoglycan-associated protein